MSARRRRCRLPPRSIAKGVSPGAALAFLMTGPATNAATIVTVWKIMGWRTGVVYLVTIMGTAMGAGLTLDAIFSIQHLPHPAPAAMTMIPPEVGSAAAVALLALLVFAMLRPLLRRSRQGASGAAVELRVGGMTCEHCAQRVTDALLACKGVSSVQVDLAGGRAAVSGQNLKAAELAKVVQDLGYDCKVATEATPNVCDHPKANT